MAAARIQRRALTLAAYNYSIKYKPGPEHANADALSRLPLPVSPPTTSLPAETVFAMELLNSTPVSVIEIRTGTRRDPILSQVMKVRLARSAQLQFRGSIEALLQQKG